MHQAPAGDPRHESDPADGDNPLLDASIFRAYDIRGIADGNLTEAVARQIGRAFATVAQAAGQDQAMVARDGRLSSPRLQAALIAGLKDAGLAVTDIGVAPTPLLYFAVATSGSGAGVMVTGSHNPANYNGLKMVLGGQALSEQEIQGLRLRIEQRDFVAGEGRVAQRDFADAYLQRIRDDISLGSARPAPLRVVVDCGNGVAGLIAPRLLEMLGCVVDPLYCEVDGHFPNHHPDPLDPHTLTDLIHRVTASGADCGLAFDGDGDRLGLVTNTGKIIWPDRLMMLYADDVLASRPGATVVCDVKCGRGLHQVIRAAGGAPDMWRTGHSHVKARVQATGALLAGEFSGHICFADRWFGFDDALYAAARLVQLLSHSPETADAIFRRYPEHIATPELQLPATDASKFQIVEALAHGEFAGGEKTTLDGVRVDYADGWGLIRASNTNPLLSLRFEANTTEALQRIQGVFQGELNRVNPNLRIPIDT